MPLEFSQNNDGNKGKKGNSADFTRRIQKILGGQIVQRGLPSSDIGLKRRDPVEVEKTPLEQLSRATTEVSKLRQRYDWQVKNYEKLQKQAFARDALLAYLESQPSQFTDAEWSRLTDLHKKYEVLMNDQLYQSAEEAVRYGLDIKELEERISEYRFAVVSEEERSKHQAMLKDPSLDPVEAQRRYQSAMGEARKKYEQEQESYKAGIASLKEGFKGEQERYQSFIEGLPNQTDMGNIDRISADELGEYQNRMAEERNKVLRAVGREKQALVAQIQQLKQQHNMQNLLEMEKRVQNLTRILQEVDLEEISVLKEPIVQEGLSSSGIGSEEPSDTQENLLEGRHPVEVEKTALWQLMRAKFEVSKLNQQYDLEKENYKNLQGQLSAKKALLAYLKGQSSEFEAAEWSRLTDLHNKYKLLMNDQIHQSAEKAIRYGIDRTELQKKISEDRFTMVSEEEQRRHQTRLKEPGQDPVEAQKRYESAMDEARNRYEQEQESCKAEIAALEKWSKEEQERYQSCIEDSPNQTHMGNLDRISADELEEYQNWMTEQGDRFMKEFKNLGAKIEQLEQELHEKKERMKMLTKILPEMNLEETQDKEVQITSSPEETQDKQVQIASSLEETQDKEVQVVFSPEEYRGKMAVHHREQVRKSELRELFEQYDREKKNREKLQCQLDARNALFDYLKGQSSEFGADDWSRRTDLHNKYKLLIHAEIHQSVEKEIGYGIDITELQKKDSEDQFAVVSEEEQRRHQARLEEPGQDPVEAQKRYESAMDKARNKYGQEQESYQDRIASLKEKFEKEQKVYDTIQTKRSELGLDPISGDELKEYQNWMTEQRNRVLEKVNTEERDLVAQIKQLEQQQYDMDIKQELDEKNKRVRALARILQKVNWEEIQDKEVQVAVSPGYFASFEDGWRSVVKQLLKMKQEGRGSKVPNYTVDHLWKVMPDRAGPALEGMEALGLEVPWEYFALLAKDSSMEEEPSHGSQQHEKGADNGISPEEQHKEQVGRRRKRRRSDPSDSESDSESEQGPQPDKKKRKKK